MQSLRAPERPVSHYRNGKLRSEPEKKFELRLGRAPAAAAHSDAGDAPALRAAVGATERILARALEEERELVRDSRMSRAAAFMKRPVAALPAPGEVFRTTRTHQQTERRDPAPSRLAYRIERLWLTPYFRVFMRFGLPVVLLGAVMAIYLGDQGRRDALSNKFAALKAEVENRPEFMVNLMSIDGVSEPVADAIRKMLPISLPASSFALDLDALQSEIEKVDAVESASLMIKAGGVLAVQVIERKPAVLWRTEASLEMLDATGHRVATLLDRSARPDLPVIAGPGADLLVSEALAILAAAQPILPRVRGLVRIGDRRWDLVLDRNQRIMLPEAAPVLAVQRVMATDGAEELLARDLSVVDLRNADRPTIRLSQAAVEATRKLTETVTKVADQ